MQEKIITIYCLCADFLAAYGYQDDAQAQMSTAEVMTVALVAATGGASTPAFYARVFTELLDVPIKLIVGYKSQSDAFLGMERGENEGSAGTYY